MGDIISSYVSGEKCLTLEGTLSIYQIGLNVTTMLLLVWGKYFIISLIRIIIIWSNENGFTRGDVS